MQRYTRVEIQSAALKAGVAEDTLDRIFAALSDGPAAGAQFETAHTAYYLGALLIIGAMGWFVTNAWDRLSGVALFLVAVVYALAFAGAAKALAPRAGTRLPAGLLTTVAVCMTPLAVYGIEKQMGWWPATVPGGYAEFHPLINGSWVWMECATILVAAIALRFVRFPFVTAPAAYALWYLSMDATALVFGKQWTFKQECWISVGFGVVMLLLGYFADGETDLDFAFWFYLFGLLTFTGGLTLLGDGSQLGKAIYCLLHLAMIVLAIVLQRRVFLVFGGLGVFCYLASEATGFFRNSFSFTVALTLIGIGFLVAGLLYKRSEKRIAARLAPYVPARVRHRHDSAVAIRS